MKRTIVVLAVLLLMSGWICDTTAMAADSKKGVLATLEEISAIYAMNNGTGRVNILKELAESKKVDSHVIFYSLLRTANKSELPYFGTVLEKHGTIELLLDFSHYLKVIKTSFEIRIKDKNISSAEMLAIEREFNQFVEPLLGNLTVLSPEIAIIARKNPVALVKAIEKVFIEKKEDVYLAGPLLGLFSLKEEGAVAFLKTIDSNSESGDALVILAEALGPYVVIPTLKQYEDPASTAVQRETASLVIFMFSDIEPVYEKVVEAYRHGHYFESNAGKNEKGKTALSLSDIFEMSSSWWGNYLKSKYRDNKKFALYVARNHLKNPDGQERIIEFLADVNLGVVAPYFAELDFTKISEKSLDALIQVTHILPANYISPVNKKDYQAEKFNLFSLIFKKLNVKSRAEKEIIYKLLNFSPEYKELFVTSNIGTLTDDEKITIVYSCSWDGLGEKMPEDVRRSILNTLRKNASTEVLEVIEYIEKKT